MPSPTVPKPLVNPMHEEDENQLKLDFTPPLPKPLVAPMHKKYEEHQSELDIGNRTY